MSTTTYQKTPAGLQEIQARQLRLQPRLRSLLVLVDGKTPAAKQIESLSSLGVTPVAFDELLRLGLIAPVANGSLVIDEILEAEEAYSLERGFASFEAFEVTETSPSTEEEARLRKSRELYAFFNSAIRSTLGLRGFMLQLQVEKASNLDDYTEIRSLFLAAVRKAKGDELATQLNQRIEAIIAGA